MVLQDSPEYGYGKDMLAILEYPLSNQLLFIASNQHVVMVNNASSVSSNIPIVEGVRANIANGTYSNVIIVSSNQVTICYDVIPYETNRITLGGQGKHFNTIFTKELYVGTAGCNVRMYREQGSGVNGDVLNVSTSLHTSRVEIQNTNEFLPVGSILPFGGSILPPGYLWCDGVEVSKVTYSKLYNVIGDMYGAGNGATFRLPDFRGRSPFGADTGPFELDAEYWTSNYGGSETITLTTNNMPSHQHIFNIKTSGANVPQGSYGLIPQLFTRPLTDTSKFIAYDTDTIGTGTEPEIIDGSVSGASFTTNTNGSGGAFTCVHPVLVTNFMIRY